MVISHPSFYGDYTPHAAKSQGVNRVTLANGMSLPPLTVSLRREREKKGRRELEKGEEIW
jgi:hypothetical protein